VDNIYMIKFSILLTLVLFTPVLAATEVTAHIEKNKQGQWWVSFRTATPVQQIVFQRNPDDSRAKYWRAQSESYSIKVQDGRETIRRADGQAFTEARFRLPAVYAPLPKEYAAFSPFSDGGMLLHSGRFFACAEHCATELNSWTLTLSALADEKIIVAGKVYQQQATWQDKDSGTSIYLGKATPLAGPDFISMIDPALPLALQQQISSQLPLLMAWFTTHMGALDFRPALFASYSSTQDGSYGHQGGILPGQIFMHWYGRTAIEQLQPDAVFWFFAHEVAHLYQRNAGAIEAQQDAWIHEGAAEYMAGLASAAVQKNEQILQKKLAIAGKQCVAGLEKQRSYAKAAAANTQLHYSCGLVLNHAISMQLQKAEQPISLFELWSLFNAVVKSGQTAQAAVFLDVLKPHVTKEFWLQLNEFSSQENFDAYAFMQQL
jgi:uncharacterized membrane protein YfbV (UPF0208 family)